MDEFFDRIKMEASKVKEEAEKYTKVAVSKTKEIIDKTKYSYTISELSSRKKDVLSELGEIQRICRWQRI